MAGKNNLRVALAQINTTVGAIDKNADKIIDYIFMARERGADIVAFPELALSGYPPEDLLLKKPFLDKNKKALKRIINMSKSIFVMVGLPLYNRQGIYNGAALIYNRRLIGTYYKMVIPDYGVFGEKRYFERGIEVPIMSFGRGMNVGVNICEDIWHPLGPHRDAALAGKAK